MRPVKKGFCFNSNSLQQTIFAVALIYMKYFKYLHSTGHDGTRLSVKCLLAKAVNAQVTDGVIEYICIIIESNVKVGVLRTWAYVNLLLECQSLPGLLQIGTIQVLM